jgi:hypothetical protein
MEENNFELNVTEKLNFNEEILPNSLHENIINLFIKLFNFQVEVVENKDWNYKNALNIRQKICTLPKEITLDNIAIIISLLKKNYPNTAENPVIKELEKQLQSVSVFLLAVIKAESDNLTDVQINNILDIYNKINYNLSPRDFIGLNLEDLKNPTDNFSDISDLSINSIFEGAEIIFGKHIVENRLKRSHKQDTNLILSTLLPSLTKSLTKILTLSDKNCINKIDKRNQLGFEANYSIQNLQNYLFDSLQDQLFQSSQKELVVQMKWQPNRDLIEQNQIKKDLLYDKLDKIGKSVREVAQLEIKRNKLHQARLQENKEIIGQLEKEYILELQQIVSSIPYQVTANVPALWFESGTYSCFGYSYLLICLLKEIDINAVFSFTPQHASVLVILSSGDIHWVEPQYFFKDFDSNPLVQKNDLILIGNGNSSDFSLYEWLSCQDKTVDNRLSFSLSQKIRDLYPNKEYTDTTIIHPNATFGAVLEGDLVDKDSQDKYSNSYGHIGQLYNDTDALKKYINYLDISNQIDLLIKECVKLLYKNNKNNKHNNEKNDISSQWLYKKIFSCNFDQQNYFSTQFIVQLAQKALEEYPNNISLRDLCLDIIINSGSLADKKHLLTKIDSHISRMDDFSSIKVALQRKKVNILIRLIESGEKDLEKLIPDNIKTLFIFLNKTSASLQLNIYFDYLIKYNLINDQQIQDYIDKYYLQFSNNTIYNFCDYIDWLIISKQFDKGKEYLIKMKESLTDSQKRAKIIQMESLLEISYQVSNNDYQRALDLCLQININTLEFIESNLLIQQICRIYFKINNLQNQESQENLMKVKDYISKVKTNIAQKTQSMIRSLDLEEERQNFAKEEVGTQLIYNPFF